MKAIAAVFFVLMLVHVSARGQVQDKKFNLNEPIEEVGILICFKQADAQTVINGEESAVASIAKEKRCVQVRRPLVVVYRNLVYREWQEDVPFSVYQADVSNQTVYIPMGVYTHRDNSI